MNIFDEKNIFIKVFKTKLIKNTNKSINSLSLSPFLLEEKNETVKRDYWMIIRFVDEFFFTKFEMDKKSI